MSISARSRFAIAVVAAQTSRTRSSTVPLNSVQSDWTAFCVRSDRAARICASAVANNPDGSERVARSRPRRSGRKTEHPDQTEAAIVARVTNQMTAVRPAAATAPATTAA